MVSNIMTFRNHPFYEIGAGLKIIPDQEKVAWALCFFNASRIAAVLPFSNPASKVR